jgi:hypothetical protein
MRSPTRFTGSGGVKGGGPDIVETRSSLAAAGHARDPTVGPAAGEYMAAAVEIQQTTATAIYSVRSSDTVADTWVLTRGSGAVLGSRSRVVLVVVVLAAVLVATQVAVAARPMRAVSRAADSVAVSASRWSIIHSPSRRGDELDAVSCVSATDCTAIGDDQNTGSSVKEQWDGAAWSIVPSPTGGDGWAGVSCVSVSDCTAVGEQWNGTVWSITPFP